MISDDIDMNQFLKPRDVSTLPKRRGREASTFYARLVAAFMSSGEKAMEVDVARIGSKPQTVRAALVRAIKLGGVQDKVRVSLLGEEVILLLR